MKLKRCENEFSKANTAFVKNAPILESSILPRGDVGGDGDGGRLYHPALRKQLSGFSRAGSSRSYLELIGGVVGWPNCFLKNAVCSSNNPVF